MRAKIGSLGGPGRRATVALGNKSPHFQPRVGGGSGSVGVDRCGRGAETCDLAGVNEPCRKGYGTGLLSGVAERDFSLERLVSCREQLPGPSGC